MILGSRVDMKLLKNTPNDMRFLTYTIIMILSEYPVASQPIFSC